MEPQIQAKVIAMTALAAGSLILGLFPIWLAKRLQWRNENGVTAKVKNVLSGFLCFGAGILVATAYTHLLPEVRIGIAELQHEKYVPPSLPIGELIFMAGILLVYLVEKLVHWISAKQTLNKTDSSIQKSDEALECRVSRETQLVSVCPSSDEMGNCQSNPCISYAPGSNNQVNIIMNPQQVGSIINNKELGRHHHHHNHHIPDNVDRVIPTVGSLLVVIGLSLHELFEGMAVGLEDSSVHVYALFAAIALHKFVIVFCVGLEMATSRVKLSVHILYMMVLAFITSLGIGVGMLVTDGARSNALTLATLVLQGLASGTLIYVAVFEVLAREESKSTILLLPLITFSLGFLAFVGFQALLAELGYDHYHHHHHAHDHQHSLHDHHD